MNEDGYAVPRALKRLVLAPRGERLLAGYYHASALRVGAAPHFRPRATGGPVTTTHFSPHVSPYSARKLAPMPVSRSQPLGFPFISLLSGGPGRLRYLSPQTSLLSSFGESH
jgi:hypothetical protein